jgi:hypothetical protein
MKRILKGVRWKLLPAHNFYFRAVTILGGLYKAQSLLFVFYHSSAISFIPCVPNYYTEYFAFKH